MPFVAFNDLVSGEGSTTLTADRVYYLAWAVTVEGPRVRRPQESDLHTLNGVGFVQLGNDLSPGGIILATGWGPQIWLNTDYGQVVADGGEVSGGFLRWIASEVRWSLGLGTEIRLVVFGDTA
ncbi:MAG TPA: hypothetical protein VFH51_15950 [Myxococcota bacterium]|nr:hypothetical protein [Myxococcota bacterium]